MADVLSNVSNSEALNPQIAERSKQVNVALDTVGNRVGKWLALTVLATKPDTSVTCWQIAQTISKAEGGRLKDYPRREGMSLYDFCAIFADANIVTTSTKAGYRRDGRTATYQLSAELGTIGAAVAAVLMKNQLDYPDAEVADIFDEVLGRGTPGEAAKLNILALIAKQSTEDFVALTNVFNGTANGHYYSLIDSLVNLGILDRISKYDPNSRTFTIIKKPKLRSNSTPERQILAEVTMALQKDGTDRFSGKDLIDTIATMFPHANIKAVWHNLTDKLPVYLRSELPHPLKGDDKIAVRINENYSGLVVQLLKDLLVVTNSLDAQNEAIKYGQEILKSEELMAKLMEIAHPRFKAVYYIPAPDYEGWHADRDQNTWKPELPPYRPPIAKIEDEIAELAIRASSLPRPRVPLSNRVLL